MAESGDEIIPLNENTQITLPSDANQLAVARRELEGNKVIPLNEETQIALPSDENQLGVALPCPVQPSFHLNKGTFDKPNFGPQTNTKHVEANTIEHATITHVHHHYGGDDKSEESPSTSGATGARPKQNLEEGFVQITDNIFMNTKKPLKEGTRIYEGYQEHVTGQRQPLAIKAIFPCTEKSIREVQHLITLTPHSNVVRIISSKEFKAHLPTLYIAMELCDSKNLQDYLHENRKKNIPFDFRKTMLYSKRLLKGIKHIHRNRIVHGNLKPQNILFSLNGDQIKVSDFGISKQLKEASSFTKRTSQGTDGYRAPETYNTDVISMKADIFSLGVTLYSLWTNGQHPYGSDLYVRIVNIIQNVDPDLSGLPEEMGDKKNEFLDLLGKMLEFVPEKRPTIEEISQHPFFSATKALVGTPAEISSKRRHSDASNSPTSQSSASSEKRPRKVSAIYPFHASSCLPSSSHEAGPSNMNVVGIDCGRKESEMSEILKNVAMNADKLTVWSVNATSNWALKRYCDKVIGNMDKGCRIYGGQLDREISLPEQKVTINGEEMLITELDEIELTEPFALRSFSGSSAISKLWPGLVV